MPKIPLVGGSGSGGSLQGQHMKSEGASFSENRIFNISI